MSFEPFIAVVTTTYNMGDTIERTYQSITAQSYKKFYWLVIDNGSTDDTCKIVKNLAKENKINIEYFYKEHGIRATAINAMLEKVHGDICVEIHADDRLTPRALDYIVGAWNSIPLYLRDNYWCVTSNCCNASDGKIVGKKFPKNINNNEKKAFRLAFNTKGEKHYSMNISIIKQKRLDINIPKRITYLSEAMLWMQYQHDYFTWFSNQITREYFDDSENRYSKPQADRRMRLNAMYSTVYILNNIFCKERTPFFIWFKYNLLMQYSAIKLNFSMLKTYMYCKNKLDKCLIFLFYYPLKCFSGLRR